jgi:hypothetical protein
MRRSLGVVAVLLALAGACGSRVALQDSATPADRTPTARVASSTPTTGAVPEVEPGTVATGALAPRATVTTSVTAGENPTSFVVATAGNGILYDIEPALRAGLAASGFFNHAMGGFGVSVLPEVWRGVLGNDVPSSDPDVIIVMLGQRDFPVALADPDTYRSELDEAVRLLSSTGARILWLGLPPQPPWMLDDAGRRAVNALFAELPARFPGVVRYVPTDPVLAAPDGSFVRALPDAEGALVPVRKVQPTGIPDEHICPDGAVRVTDLVRRELAVFMTVPGSPPAWPSAGWRAEPRYDDPVGACRP